MSHPTSDSDPGALDDATLAGLIAGRDPDALAELYQRYGTACYRLARHITASDTLAEDAVQEAFLGLWRSPDAYSAGRGSLRNWLLGTTHHKAVDFVRRETAQQRRQAALAAESVFGQQPEADPAAISIGHMRAEKVRDALAELPRAQCEAVALAYFGGYTQREIAQLTGVPLGTVKTRTLAAMQRMRSRLATLADLPRKGA